MARTKLTAQGQSGSKKPRVHALLAAVKGHKAAAKKGKVGLTPKPRRGRARRLQRRLKRGEEFLLCKRALQQRLSGGEMRVTRDASLLFLGVVESFALEIMYEAQLMAYRIDDRMTILPKDIQLATDRFWATTCPYGVV
jgi:histone H3/H4